MMTRKKIVDIARRKAWADARGAELLEFAFVLPVLMMLLLGIFWVARAWSRPRIFAPAYQ